MFSSGSARMSSVASASEGMTFAPTPALRMVGTTDVRSIEYSSGSFSRRNFCALAALFASSSDLYTAARSGELMVAIFSK